jgi:hypothetical protein
MGGWLQALPYDPLPGLLSAGNAALAWFAPRDLQEAPVPPAVSLWDLPGAIKILDRQRADGSWAYPGSTKSGSRVGQDYDQLETYRQFGYLVEKFAMYRSHPAMTAAAEFLFSRQTGEGDFRGIYGRQYTPNYSAAILELLVKAGYADDARVRKGLDWLLEMRQRDGGWAIPLRTSQRKLDVDTMEGVLIQPAREKPFSHMVTGVVLRAFAAHPAFRSSPEIRRAGDLLASHLFARDNYSDRGTVKFWTSFSFPFWFTDLVSALDSLSRLGFQPDNPAICRGLDWFAERQRADGGWNLTLLRAGSDRQLSLWVGLAICRVFKRFYA